MKLRNVKKDLLFTLKSLRPLLKETTDFYLYGSLGYNLTLISKLFGDSAIADIRRAEVEGLKDGYNQIENMSDVSEYRDINEAKEAIIASLNDLRGEDRFYNFSIERVIGTVKQLSKKLDKCVSDTAWSIAYIGDTEVVIPGNSEGINSLLGQERKIYWKTYSFLSQLKKYYLKGAKPQTHYFCFPISLSKVMRNYEISEKNTHLFILTQLSQVLESYFPSLHFEGTRIKASIFPPLIFFVLTSIDIICILDSINRQDRAFLFLLPISEYSIRYEVIHISLIMRFLCFLEEGIKENNWKPLSFWITKDYLHCCLPPDSKPYYRKDGIVFFFSRKTGFYFHCVEEGDPYYRVTILPQEYLELFFNQENERIKNGGNNER